MKLSDVVKIIPKFDKYGDPLPFFTKTEKQQIEGAPEGITQEKQIFNLIVGLDLPITDKIGLLGEFGFVDFRNRIEKDDQELGLASFDDNRKKIGIRYGGDDDSLSGRVMYDPDTKNISLGVSKKFAKGGRIGFFKGAQADASAGKGAMSPGTDTGGGFRGGGDDNRDRKKTEQYKTKSPTGLSDSKQKTPVVFNPFKNLSTHFVNNQKLKDAVDAGLLTNEEYNILGGYDAKQTLGMGPIDTGLASFGYNTVQSLIGNQPFSDIFGDVARNVKGATNISPELQAKYESIIQMAEGGRIGFKGGADMGTVADSQGNVGGQSVDISSTGDVRTSDKPPNAPDDRASDAQNFTNFLATQTNLKPKEIRRITGNQSFLERFGPNILRAAIYGYNPALGIGSLNARDVINLYDAFEAGKVINDEDLTLGKLGITSLAKGGRVNYQDGTSPPTDEEIMADYNQAKFNIEKGLDNLTGIGSIRTDFPGSFSAASGVPSDFRHQAAANLLAETLGKGAYSDPILGPISYLSGAFGASGLGAIKEVVDLGKGLMDPNLTKKEAFSEFLKDNLSNIKGAFKLPGTTTEQLYDEIMGDYEVKPNFAFDPLLMNLRADRVKQIEDARKRALKNIQNQRDSKPTTTVTGTTKPGTAGPAGRDSKPTTGGFSAPTKQGQSPRGTTTTSSSRQTAREDRRGGQYGFASGGLARMLGE